MEVFILLLEGIVSHIAPQYGRKTKLVGLRKGVTDLHDLATAFRGAEIDRRSNRGGPHIDRLSNRAKEYLIELVRIGEQFVMVDLHQERDLVGIASGDHAQDA